jgi:hypothetical protein
MECQDLYSWVKDISKGNCKFGLPQLFRIYLFNCSTPFQKEIQAYFLENFRAHSLYILAPKKPKIPFFIESLKIEINVIFFTFRTGL